MSATRAFLTAGSKLSALLAFFAVAAVAGTLIACVITPGIAVAGTAAKKQISVFQDLPSNLEITPLAQKTRLYAKQNGKDVLLASFFDQNRDVIKWDQVPATVKNAAIAGEDIRFYQHGAVDPNGIARAVVQNLRGNDIQGASTITQQYVKNVCIQQAETIGDAKKMRAAYDECIEPSINRKIREMRLAIGVEKKYAKDDILLGYLNIAGFGGRTYGIEAAAHYYFDKSAKDLSIGEAATLLSIVNNPEAFRLDKKENLEGAETRRNYILAAERDHGMITPADYEKYAAEDIETEITQPSTGCQTAGSAAFFCTYVVNTILTSDQFGKTVPERRANLNNKGWRIHTTLDLDLQKKAQKAVNYYVPQSPGYADVGAATTSVQVGTGRVLTMVQNKTFKPNGAKNRTKYSAVNFNVNELLGAGAGFQPGSTFKAFNMVGWLKSGHSMNQVVNGNGRTIPLANYTACGSTYGSGPYQFKNDNPATDKGNYTVQAGTAGSVNGVFQSMAQEQDLCEMRDIAESLGARNALLQRYEKGKKKGQVVYDKNGDPKIARLEATPAAAIGTGSSIAPLDMATAYATIANKGVRCTTIGIDSITDSDGKKVPVPGANCKRVQDEQLMIAAGYDLRNPVLSGTMRVDQLGDGKYMFGKTGTTDNAKDTWTMGSTTKVTTAVWVGNVTGNVSLRQVGAPHACNLGGMSSMRHCIFQAVQRTMNNKYGGDSGWPYPAGQYVTGGKAIVHADARPVAAPPKPSKSDDEGDDEKKSDDDR